MLTTHTTEEVPQKLAQFQKTMDKFILFTVEETLRRENEEFLQKITTSDRVEGTKEEVLERLVKAYEKINFSENKEEKDARETEEILAQLVKAYEKINFSENEEEKGARETLEKLLAPTGARYLLEFKYCVLKCYENAQQEANEDNKQRRLNDLEFIFSAFCHFTNEIMRNKEISLATLDSLLDPLIRASIPLGERIFSLCFAFLAGIMGAAIGAAAMATVSISTSSIGRFFMFLSGNQYEMTMWLISVPLATFTLIVASPGILGGTGILTALNLASFIGDAIVGAMKGFRYSYNKGYFASRYYFFNSILNETHAAEHKEIRTKACQFINNPGLIKTLHEDGRITGSNQEALFNAVKEKVPGGNGLAKLIVNYSDPLTLPSFGIR